MSEESPFYDKIDEPKDSLHNSYSENILDELDKINTDFKAESVIKQ